jgi:cyclophilin family peptidyl-prolyl cis-trans isomerase
VRRARQALGGLAALCAALAAFAPPAGADCSAPNPESRRRVEVRSVLGAFCLDLLDRPGEAPLTVQNFRNYMDRGDFDGSFFHRLVPGFVLQGGGFSYDPTDRYRAIPQDPPVANEPGISNVRGTVAMAKLANQPDSATNQWFVNLTDNSASLDAQNGGFTVFARVVPEDLAVVDAIAALHREYGPYAIDDPLAGQFGNLPVLQVLDRDPGGYGCLEVNPDPVQTASGPMPTGVSTCANQTEFAAAVALTIAAMDPQVPERLVTIESVPEPGAPLLTLVGVGALALARGRRRRELG